MLIASLIQDAGCEMVADDGLVVPTEEPTLPLDRQTKTLPFYISSAVPTEAVRDRQSAMMQDKAIAAFEHGWPDQTHAWRKTPEKDTLIGEVMPGVWMGPNEYGQMPRLRVLEGWNPDPEHATLPFHPMCFSTRSEDPRFNLTPTSTEGWAPWVHPDHTDKPYLISNTPGSTFTFGLDTSLGVVKMYSLRSKTFGLGTVECWVDGQRDRSVKVNGYWDNGDAYVASRYSLTPGISDDSPQSAAISLRVRMS